MKRTLPIITASLLAIGGSFLTGCATNHDHGAWIPVNTTVNDVENHEMVVLLSPRVQYSVTCSGIQEHYTPDGRMDITAYIRNRENRRIQVQVDCMFKDAQGFPTEEAAPFQNLILTENSQEPVHYTSMNPKARHFTIRIREAH